MKCKHNYQQLGDMSIDPGVNLHHLLIQKHGLVPKPVCDFVISYARSQPYDDLGVFDAKKTNANKDLNTEWKTDTQVRNTQTVDLSPIKTLIDETLKKAVFDVINLDLHQFGVKIRDAEGVQLLRYGVGGHYLPHIDGEAVFNNHGSLEWRKSIDRDVSLVIYLSDPESYTGGEIHFPWFDMSIKPSQGQLLAFPSTHEFLHGVKPITQGERFALVTWMRICEIK